MSSPDIYNTEGLRPRRSRRHASTNNNTNDHDTAVRHSRHSSLSTSSTATSSIGATNFPDATNVKIFSCASISYFCTVGLLIYLFWSSFSSSSPSPSSSSFTSSSTHTCTCSTTTTAIASVRITTTMSDERTFIAIKPDGVQRGLINKILGRFEDRGFKLVGIKLVQPTEGLLREHYSDLQSKPFFPSLLSYMLSGPVLATVWEGKDVVKQGRAILGATNPLASAPGTIRGDFAIDMGRNVCHGSDSVESANKEIALWFKPEEVVSYKLNQFGWIYE